MILRKRRVFVILVIVIWILGIVYFTSDSGFLRGDPPKVSLSSVAHFRLHLVRIYNISFSFNDYLRRESTLLLNWITEYRGNKTDLVKILDTQLIPLHEILKRFMSASKVFFVFVD